MFKFVSGFSTERMKLAGDSGERPPGPLGRARVQSDLLVPWLRPETLTQGGELGEFGSLSEQNKVAELVNSSLLSLEKLETGYLFSFSPRFFKYSDTISILSICMSFQNARLPGNVLFTSKGERNTCCASSKPGG